MGIQSILKIAMDSGSECSWDLVKEFMDSVGVEEIRNLLASNMREVEARRREIDQLKYRIANAEKSIQVIEEKEEKYRTKISALRGAVSDIQSDYETKRSAIKKEQLKYQERIRELRSASTDEIREKIRLKEERVKTLRMEMESCLSLIGDLRTLLVETYPALLEDARKAEMDLSGMEAGSIEHKKGLDLVVQAKARLNTVLLKVHRLISELSEHVD